MHCAAIGSYDVWVDIIIPLISALIGGLVTMWGVVLTIKREQKNAEEQKHQAAKPWLYSLDRFEDYDHNKAGRIELKGNSTSDKRIAFIIKNTDNGIGIIEKFVTINSVHQPFVGRIIDRNSIVEVKVNLESGASLQNMYFIIRDIYGTRYRYNAYQTLEVAKGNHIEEVGLAKDTD